MVETSSDVSYEFSQEQNETVRFLAQRLKYVGVLNLVVGLLYGLIGLRSFLANPTDLILYAPPMLFFELVGVWTINAAKSFQNIVETNGQDIPFLMKALTELRRLYNLQFWLLLIAITMLFIAVIVGVIAGKSLGFF